MTKTRANHIEIDAKEIDIIEEIERIPDFGHLSGSLLDLSGKYPDLQTGDTVYLDLGPSSELFFYDKEEDKLYPPSSRGDTLDLIPPEMGVFDRFHPDHWETDPTEGMSIDAKGIFDAIKVQPENLYIDVSQDGGMSVVFPFIFDDVVYFIILPDEGKIPSPNDTEGISRLLAVFDEPHLYLEKSSGYNYAVNLPQDRVYVLDIEES